MEYKSCSKRSTARESTISLVDKAFPLWQSAIMALLHKNFTVGARIKIKDLDNLNNKTGVVSKVCSTTKVGNGQVKQYRICLDDPIVTSAKTPGLLWSNVLISGLNMEKYYGSN